MEKWFNSVWSAVTVDEESPERNPNYDMFYKQYADFLRNQFTLQDSHECDALLGDTERIEAYKKQANMYTNMDADVDSDSQPYWEWHKTHLHIPVRLSEPQKISVFAAVQTPSLTTSLSMVMRECARGPSEFRSVRSRDISCVCTDFRPFAEIDVHDMGVATDLLRRNVDAVTPWLPPIPFVRNTVLPPSSALSLLIAKG